MILFRGRELDAIFLGSARPIPQVGGDGTWARLVNP